MKHRASLIGVALLCLALGSDALTLGRARGAVLIGQPLELAIQIHKDAGQDAASLCFDAEVFHADARQDASRVRVVVEGAAQAQEATVRVLSSAVVDEPMVTVYLRTGCGQKTTRRYVLLADLASEIATPRVPFVALAAGPEKAGLTPPPVAAGNDWSTASSAGPVVPAPVSNTKRTRAVKPAAVRPADQNANVKPQSSTGLGAGVAPRGKTKTERAAGRARLKLDPLDFLSDRVANLDSFMNFDPTADALQTLQKIERLEGSVKTLLAVNAKNEASLLELSVRLQQAQSERFPAAVLYGLLALVLACLAAIAWLWSRQREVADPGHDTWWSGSADAHASDERDHWPGSAAMPEGGSKALATAKPRPDVASDPWDLAEPGSGVDINLMEMGHADFHDMGALPVTGLKTPSTPRGGVVAGPAGLFGGIDPQDAAKVRQRSEFFVSLGKTEQAIHILEQHLHDAAQPDPEVYLDLLSLLHSLGLKADFQKLSEAFQQHFTCQLPAFASFREEGRALEAYPQVLSPIAALWPLPKVLDVIEACIRKASSEAACEPLDLAAFRDLLLLQAVAQRVVERSSKSGTGPATTSPAKAAPISTPTYFDDSGYAGMEWAKAPDMPERAASIRPPMTDMSLDEEVAPVALDLDLDQNPGLDLDLDLSEAMLDDLADLQPPDTLDEPTALTLPEAHATDAGDLDASWTLEPVGKTDDKRNKDR